MHRYSFYNLICRIFHSPFGPGHPLHSAAAAAELERLDRDRRSIEHSEAMRLQSIAQSLGGSHGSGHPGSSGPSAHHPPTSRMSPFGPPTGTLKIKSLHGFLNLFSIIILM